MTKLNSRCSQQQQQQEYSMSSSMDLIHLHPLHPPAPTTNNGLNASNDGLGSQSFSMSITSMRIRATNHRTWLLLLLAVTCFFVFYFNPGGAIATASSGSTMLIKEPPAAPKDDIPTATTTSGDAPTSLSVDEPPPLMRTSNPDQLDQQLVLKLLSDFERIPPMDETASKSGSGTGNHKKSPEYQQLMGSRQCNCHQPFRHTYEEIYETIVSASTTSTVEEAKANLFEPADHTTNNFLRRFVKFWFQEVQSYYQDDEGGTTVPEARVLIIGDSVMRNAFHRLIALMCEEGLAHLDEYAKMQRNTAKGYHVISLTWPPRSTQATGSARSGAKHGAAKLFLRYEYQPYFSSDNYNINDTGAAEFDPTHVLIGRGLWDIVHAVPHDPSWPLASFSAGLVKLRQSLLLTRMRRAEKREDSSPLRLRPARVVYFAMPKTYGPSEGATIRDEVQHCTMNSDSLPFRDALYCAVRRANGALAMIHKRGADVVCLEMLKALGMSSTNEEALRVCREHVSSFSSFGIELLDTYGPSLAASVTRMPDGMHPNVPLNDFLMESVFHLLQRPPSSLSEAVSSVATNLHSACRQGKEMSGSSLASCVKALIESSQMFLPPPLYGTGKHSCPLAMAPADVEAMWNSPFGSIVEPLTVSPALEVTMKSQVSCKKPPDGPPLHSAATWILAAVNQANEKTPRDQPPLLPWRQILDRCLHFDLTWFKSRGCFAGWAPSTQTERARRGSFKRLTDPPLLGLNQKQHTVVQAVGGMCTKMAANLTASDFNEIWDAATQGTIKCLWGTVSATLAQPPGSRQRPIDLRKAAFCMRRSDKG